MGRGLRRKRMFIEGHAHKWIAEDLQSGSPFQLLDTEQRQLAVWRETCRIIFESRADGVQ